MSDSDGEGAVQGDVVGVIVPPPDKRVICDKTAEFVARNGPSFIKKLRASDPTGRKFSFLNGDDIYNAYFLQKIEDFQAAHAAKAEAQATQAQAEADAGISKGDGSGDGGAQNGDDSGTTTTTTQGDAGSGEQQQQQEEQKPDGDRVEQLGSVQRDAVVTIVAAAAKHIPDGEPPEELFSLMHPPSHESPMQIEIIKHTAQFTAAGGSAFLKVVASREHRNPQFDFLKHTHAYFGYFTALVESYSKILTKNSTVQARLKADALSRDHILRRCVHRMSHQRKEEERRKAEEEDGDADRIAFQSIDWHDFVVVETIDFDENEELPAPGAAPGLEGPQPAAEEEDSDDMDMDMSESEEEQSAAAPPPKVLAGSGIKIRTGYVPKVEAAAPKAVTHFIDPKTGKAVPVNDASEHMRIELMDPKYMEQQQRRLEKQRETGYAHDETISRNLAQFAKRRTDIFGGQSKAEESDVAAPAVIWDGVTADPDMKQKLTMEAARAQLAREQKARENAKPKPAIGPTVPGTSQPQPPVQQSSQPSIPLGLPGAGPPQAPPGLGAGALGMRTLMGGGMMGAPPMPPGVPPGPPGTMGAVGLAGQGLPGISQPPGVGPPGTMAGLPPGVSPHTSVSRRPEVSEDMQPPAKRSRVTEAGLQSESDWAAAYPGTQTFRVAVPSDGGNDAWGLKGQTLTVSLQMNQRLSDLKTLLSAQLGSMPKNKMQIKSAARGFLKDTFTLAHYNLAPGETLSMTVKTRGRRR